MYTVKPTKAYRKSLKKLVRSGKFDILEADRLINALVIGAVLDPEYDTHPFAESTRAVLNVTSKAICF